MNKILKWLEENGFACTPGPVKSFKQRISFYPRNYEYHKPYPLPDGTTLWERTGGRHYWYITSADGSIIQNFTSQRDTIEYLKGALTCTPRT